MLLKCCCSQHAITLHMTSGGSKPFTKVTTSCQKASMQLQLQLPTDDYTMESEDEEEVEEKKEAEETNTTWLHTALSRATR